MWYGAIVFTVLVKVGLAANPWWSNAVYYRILVDSFKDSDGDGLGDLAGAAKQISYVRALGADAVILSPISAQSTDCSKPGTMELQEIDQRYGNLQNLYNFLEKAHKLELKVLLTLPLRGVSTNSEWFSTSAIKTAGYEDRFVWKDGTSEEKPDLIQGIESWVWDENRSAYFAAQHNQAMLNLCSEAVLAALSQALCVWLKRGFDGVVLNPDYIVEQRCGERLLQKMVSEAIICTRSNNLEAPAILVETSLHPLDAAKYYSDGGVGANSVLSAALTLPSKRSAPEMALAFYSALLTAPEDAVPTWPTSALYESRITSRYTSDMVDAINLLSLILPGAVIIQQGDELGVADTILDWAAHSTCWPSPEVPSSAPFPWSDSENGGFSNGEPWLPLSPNFRYANAKTEFANENSHVGVLKVAAAMRKSPAIGPHVEIKRLRNAIAVLRWGGQGSLVVVANLGPEPTEVKLSSLNGLPNEITVATSSTGSSFSTGSHVAVDKTMKLALGEAVLLAGGPRHCGGPGPVDKIANKLNEGWQKLNKYFSNV